MKTQNPWMGRVRGSAGNMTGCKVYDKNVLRAKAFEVSNPDTAAQQTQRDFFKEVAAIVATVSEEELRSLFGIKPKTMSRRNALSKQIAAAYSIEGNVKNVDFSKLLAIGNGSSVNTPIVEFVNGITADETTITVEMLGSFASQTSNLIGIFFNTTDQAIELVNSSLLVGGNKTTAQVLESIVSGKNGYGYVTCSSSGENVSLKSYGSFIIKTRKEKVGRQTPVEPDKVTIYSGGTESGSFFHFDDSLFNNSNKDEPANIKEGITVICDEIQWDEVNNWWYGTTIANVQINKTLIINGRIDGVEVNNIPVEWVVQ